MLEIVRCETRASLRAFCHMERLVYGAHAPKRFAPVRDAVRGAFAAPEAAFLLANRNGRAAARAAVFAHGGEARFSLFEAADDPPAIEELFAAAREFCVGLGAKTLLGPLPPDGSGFGAGVLLPGGEDCSPWFPVNPARYAGLFERNGFRVFAHMNEYELPLGGGAKNPCEGAESWASRRFAITVRALPASCREALAGAYAVSGGEGNSFEAYARAYARVCALSRGGVLLLARRAGKPAGFLLCVRESAGGGGFRKGRALRVLNAHIAPEERGGPCLAALIDALFRVARAERVAVLRTGTVDARNDGSRRPAENAGARIRSRYAIYIQKLT